MRECNFKWAQLRSVEILSWSSPSQTLFMRRLHMNHEPGFLRGFCVCVCVPRIPMCVLFFKTSNIPEHEKEPEPNGFWTPGFLVDVWLPATWFRYVGSDKGCIYSCHTKWWRFDYPNPSASARSIFSWACRFFGWEDVLFWTQHRFLNWQLYNVLPLKYNIHLHANEPFNVYTIWILQLGEIPGVTPRSFIDPKLYLRFPSTSCITACLNSKCATPAAGFPKLSNDRRVFV